MHHTTFALLCFTFQVLPCLHTFCLGCLSTYLPPESLAITCPLCGQQSILPQKGVSENNAPFRKMRERQLGSFFLNGFFLGVWGAAATPTQTCPSGESACRSPLPSSSFSSLFQRGLGDRKGGRGTGSNKRDMSPLTFPSRHLCAGDGSPVQLSPADRPHLVFPPSRLARRGP